MYDYLIFDLDGTLIDSAIGIARSINHSLNYHGYAEQSASNLIKYFGPPIDHAFKHLVDSSDQSLINSLVTKFRERYSSVGYSENTLYDGIEATLRVLHDSGVSLGVCTTKRVDLAEKVLSMFGLRGNFDFVSGGDVGVQKWQQLERLLQERIITSNSIMIGDREGDLIAAHKNGLHSAGVLWGYGDITELSSHNPNFIFESPAELTKLIVNNLNSED
jgi:phosphoglycolate phosphatase